MIKKDDNVIILTGRDKGKTGKVVKSLPKLGKVIVGGMNIKKVHKKPTKSGKKGQTIEKSMPIDISNVRLAEVKNKPKKIVSKLNS